MLTKTIQQARITPTPAECPSIGIKSKLARHGPLRAYCEDRFTYKRARHRCPGKSGIPDQGVRSQKSSARCPANQPERIFLRKLRLFASPESVPPSQIGRASCRERV